MDAFPEDIKIPALASQEGTKKKKQSRKKGDTKQSKPEIEAPEVIPELGNDMDSDLVLYTYKLEAELASAKQKLKSQRQKFRQLIHGLSKTIDAKGITANIVDEYLQTLRPRLADIDNESKFEKFFTTHKYRILEDPSGHHGDKGPNKKTASKSSANMLKSSTVSDKNAANEDPLHIQSPHEGAPQNGTATKKPKKEKKEKDKDKEKEKEKDKEKTNGEGEGKKRKPKKHKESDDLSEDVVEIMEIPPPKSKPKKEDNNLKAMQQQQQQQQQPVQIPQLQQPGMQMNDDGLKTFIQQVGMDPTALMNAYLMAGQAIPGMSEQDLARYMETMLKDMMTMGVANPMRGAADQSNDMMKYYQRNFQ